MNGYTPRFLKALEAVIEAGKADERQAAPEFFKKMKALGWEERQNNLYRVKDKDDGRFKIFKWNSSQRLFARNKTGRDVILKARQFGFTTWACIYAYDRALFDGWTTGLMAHQKDRTERIFEIIKNADDWFQQDWGQFLNPEKDTSNANQIKWKESKASVTVSFDFRSLTVQFLHVSEAAFIDTERLSNSLQAVPEGGEVIEESTPNGPQGLFYSHYQQWKNDGDGAPYRGHFFPWYDHYPEHPEKWKNVKLNLTAEEQELVDLYGLKEYHLAWRRWKKASDYNDEDERFEIDYPSDDRKCFLSGESQVYSSKILKIQDRFVRKPSHVGFIKTEGKRVSFYNDPKGLLKVWSLPEPDREYCIGADASEGIGKDAAVAYVMDRDSGEIVAELYGQIFPAMFAEELYKLGQFYNYCFINPERNNHGHVIIEDLVRRGYSKIYRQQVYDELARKTTAKLGFQTTSATKIPLTEQHVNACREGKFRCSSETLFKEMSNFVQLGSKNGRSMRREARGDGKDDCVMAACLTWEMHKALGNTNRSDYAESDFVRNNYIDPDTGFIQDAGTPAEENEIDDFTRAIFTQSLGR